MSETNALAHALFTQPLSKDPNLRRVLRSIWKANGIPRINVAEALRLDKSTISKIVFSLIDAGLVYEAAEGNAGPLGGRKPVSLRIRDNFGSFLGIEIQTERYQACLVDPSGAIIEAVGSPLSFGDRPLKTVILETISEVTEKLDKSAPPILGIGLGLSGIIDSEKGIVRQSYPLSVAEPLDVGSCVGGLLSVPVRLENDARCCCWSELIRRRCARVEDFMFLLGEFRKKEMGPEQSRGIAVGTALVLNEIVHRGADGTAGEFNSVFRVTTTRSQFSLPDQVVADAGESLGAFETVLGELSPNIGLLVNMLDLRQVVIGGVFDRHRESCSRILRTGIERNIPYPAMSRCDISYSELGDKVVAHGAAAMLVDRLFAQP
jgi:predicted NBD/HSP70 family sugar kinase